MPITDTMQQHHFGSSGNRIILNPYIRTVSNKEQSRPKLIMANRRIVVVSTAIMAILSQTCCIVSSFLVQTDYNTRPHTTRTTTTPRGGNHEGGGCFGWMLWSQRPGPEGDLFAAVHRKEYEMKQVNAQHAALSDPVRMAMSYTQETEPPLRLARALRRVYEDPTNPANPDYVPPTSGQDSSSSSRPKNGAAPGLAELGMRRGCFVVDIKRKSLSGESPNRVFARFDDAGMVAEAMVGMGADVVLVNVDYPAYGGDMTELRSVIAAVKRSNPRAAVVMKDIVVDEIQLGLAKDAGADGVLLISSVLGPALGDFLNLATEIGLETIVECHTRNEVAAALDALAQTILVSNYDRIERTYHPDQAYRLAGMFPGSGGPIITLAGGGIESTDQMKRLLAVGYDGVIVGRAMMGSSRAPEFIRAVKDRTLLPAELSQWGRLEEAEFDPDGNFMPGPKDNIPSPLDETSFQ